jgi:hypothetical protein
MWWHRGTIGSFIFVAKTKYIISMCWYGQFFFKYQTEIFISNFKNEKFQSFPFLISKMKTSNFFSFQIFAAYFYFFSFPSGGTTDFFSNFKIDFFQFFPFPCGGMAIFFQNSKTKISIQISKMIFSKKFILIFSCGINEFFSRPKVAKFIKRLQKLPFYPYQK